MNSWSTSGVRGLDGGGVVVVEEDCVVVGVGEEAREVLLGLQGLEMVGHVLELLVLVVSVSQNQAVELTRSHHYGEKSSTWRNAAGTKTGTSVFSDDTTMALMVSSWPDRKPRQRFFPCPNGNRRSREPRSSKSTAVLDRSTRGSTGQWI
jgi:hypothetical protein